MSQEMPVSTPPPIESPAKNPFERMIGVLFSPSSAFEDINRKPDWLVPMILILLVALATTYVFLSQVDMLELVKAQIEKSGRPLPPDEALQGSLKFSTIISYGAVLAGVPISYLVLGGILLVVFGFLLGAETTFKKVYCANVYASVPSLVKGLIAIPILFVKQPTEFGNPADIVQSNLGVLFDPTQKALHALGKSIDVFTIWYLLVLAIGLVKVSKGLTFQKALTTLVVLWALVVIAVVGWAAFR